MKMLYSLYSHGLLFDIELIFGFDESNANFEWFYLLFSRYHASLSEMQSLTSIMWMLWPFTIGLQAIRESRLLQIWKGKPLWAIFVMFCKSIGVIFHFTWSRETVYFLSKHKQDERWFALAFGITALCCCGTLPLLAANELFQAPSLSLSLSLSPNS